MPAWVNDHMLWLCPGLFYQRAAVHKEDISTSSLYGGRVGKIRNDFTSLNNLPPFLSLTKGLYINSQSLAGRWTSCFTSWKSRVLHSILDFFLLDRPPEQEKTCRKLLPMSQNSMRLLYSCNSFYRGKPHNLRWCNSAFPKVKVTVPSYLVMDLFLLGVYLEELVY